MNTTFDAIGELVEASPECASSVQTWIAVALGVLLGLSEAMGCTENVKTNGLLHAVKVLVTSQCLRRRRDEGEEAV